METAKATLYHFLEKTCSKNVSSVSRRASGAASRSKRAVYDSKGYPRNELG
jgi:hypothetical protein